MGRGLVLAQQHLPCGKGEVATAPEERVPVLGVQAGHEGDLVLELRQLSLPATSSGRTRPDDQRGG
ncbi:hypothetical protein GCM10017674_53500 [Streptomyces gardneri]|nr:hypothetical protein GCM10017674_53500 [Streptomyces gardneri]